MKKNNNSKQINTELIRESLLDYNNLATQLKESTPSIVKNLLAEQVKQAYAAILNESEDDELEDKDYEVEEVDDTNADVSKDGEVEDTVDTDDDSLEDEEDVETEDSEEGKEPEVEDELEVDIETNTDDTDGEELNDIDQDFEKFKTSDNEYDFRNAEDEEIVKVYKLLKNDDNVTVVKGDDGKIQLSDNETGAEYIINFDDNTSNELTDDNFNAEDMNESRIYEIALNEYDSHVGYTDNYQKKDVMTNDGVSEPSKNGRDIDKGVPTGASKPWSKQKKNVAPFNGEKGKTVECGNVENLPEIEESNIGAKHGHTAKGMVKFHDTTSGDENKNPYNKKVVSAGGEYKGNIKAEAIEKKAAKIFEENKKLKKMLAQFEQNLQEAAVVNVNLGGIIKLISENSTTMEEKKSIINRFTNEVHTINESKILYQRISEELKKKPAQKADINEEKQFGKVETINESKFYQDENLMSSLGLMHKICK